MIFVMTTLGKQNDSKTIENNYSNSVESVIQKYTSAYSHSDINIMRNILSTPMLLKYRDTYLYYRKNSIKPKIAIDIQQVKFTIPYVIVLTKVSLNLNKESLYKDKLVEFILKKGERKNWIISEINTATDKNIFNFWEAINWADCFGIFTVSEKKIPLSKKKNSIFLRLWKFNFKKFATSVDAKLFKSRKIVPVLNGQIKVFSQGECLIPLAINVKGELVAVGSNYSVPVVDDSDIQPILSLLKQWRKGNDLNLCKQIFMDNRFKNLYNDLLSLITSKLPLNRSLNNIELVNYLQLVEDQKIPVRVRVAIISLLCQKNFHKLKDKLYKLLEDKSIYSQIASILAQYDYINFRDKMLKQLSSSKNRNLALSNSNLFVRDELYIKKAAPFCSLKQVSVKDLSAVFPVLISPYCQGGKKRISNFLQENSDFNKSLELLKLIEQYRLSSYFIDDISHLAIKLSKTEQLNSSEIKVFTIGLNILLSSGTPQLLLDVINSLNNNSSKQANIVRFTLSRVAGKIENKPNTYFKTMDKAIHWLKNIDTKKLKNIRRKGIN